ncbi:MAG TPA: PAS domain-containing sensor histidine kinase [Clostridia bacterium]|nr:PAS domain-containing sensor histidine kinase [Clostridia bacterium]
MSNERPHTARNLAWLGLILATVLLASSSTQAAALPELRTAAQIRKLSADEAERRYPVRLRGVVTYFNEVTPSKAFRFFQDDTAGIYFYTDANTINPGLMTGQQVELEGWTGKGEFAPTITVGRAQVLGQGPFPPAKPVSFEQLVTGREDSQFVEIHGVVRSVRLEDQRLHFIVEVATGDGRLVAYASQLPVPRGEDLIDSTVRLRGVCFTQFNRQRQFFDFGLVVPRPEDLMIEMPAPVDPFAMPLQPIKSLLQYSAQGSYGHRLKIAGSVILRSGDRLYIQDGEDGVCVQTKQASGVDVGDRVEVLGFPARGEYTPRLDDGVFRKIDSAPIPRPEQVTADQALQGDHDCRLVTVEAVLLDRAQHSQEPFLVLQSGGFVFHAHLRGNDGSAKLNYLQNGSKVAVTGVCLIEAGQDWYYGENWRAASFRVLLRSPEDIVVLQKPPWWTLQRLLWATGLLCAAVLGAFGWVAFLRRRVRKQTQIINQKLQAEAALKERYLELFENANDVVFTHDLTGQITSMNSTGERLLQRPRQDILSRNITALIVEEQRPAAREWLYQVINGVEVPAAEWDFLNAAGQRVKLEINTRMIAQEGRYLEVEGIGRDITERKRLEKEILEISSKEQQRIGHDLHDGVCQQLAAISYRTHILARRLQDKAVPESAEAENIGQLISESLVQTRGVARGLFPVRLEENGLVSALEELAANTTALFKVPCAFSCQEPPPIIDNSVALHVYYIVQEALLNAARHSRATAITVRLAPAADRLVLSVHDDGSGFQLSETHRAGMGIGIMRYRARVIGANLDLKTRPGHGTQLVCAFQPLSQNDPGKSA